MMEMRFTFRVSRFEKVLVLSRTMISIGEPEEKNPIPPVTQLCNITDLVDGSIIMGLSFMVEGTGELFIAPPDMHFRYRIIPQLIGKDFAFALERVL